MGVLGVEIGTVGAAGTLACRRPVVSAGEGACRSTIVEAHHV